jgi:hypothetical protein
MFPDKPYENARNEAQPVHDDLPVLFVVVAGRPHVLLSATADGATILDELSVRRQCELLGLNRSSLYYEPVGETPEDLRLMRLIDEQYGASGPRGPDERAAKGRRILV